LNKCPSAGITPNSRMMAGLLMMTMMCCALLTSAKDLPAGQEEMTVGGGGGTTTTTGFIPKLSRMLALDEVQWSNARLLKRHENKHREKQQESQQQLKQEETEIVTNEMENEQVVVVDGTTTEVVLEEGELDLDMVARSATDDDLGNGDIEIFIDDEVDSSVSSEEPSSSCRSVIAVNGWRLLTTSTESYDMDAMYPDEDVTLPYNDSSTVLPTEEDFVCEMSNGRVLPVRGTDEQVAELRHMLNKGHLISALSSIEVNTAQGISDGSGSTSSGYSSNSVTLPEGPIKITTNSEENSRRLSSVYEGIHRVLVIRVTDRDGLAVPEDAATISDKFFGTYGDTRTLVSGFRRCSFGKLLMTNDYGTDEYDNLLASPGVMELTIDVGLQSSTQEEIAESAQRALATKLGHELPGPFHHIAFVLEGCYQIETTCEFAAYAFVNHWLSVFIGENYKYPAVTMHEFGHNMNLAHSGGTDGEIYTDHTCLMGNPLFSDDVGMMCFNPAKNYQISVGSGR